MFNSSSAPCTTSECQEIFDGWAAQLDKLCTKKFEERERVLRHHLTLLREDVGYCSRATDAILLCHAQFAYLMAQRIDDASRSWLKGSNLSLIAPAASKRFGKQQPPFVDRHPKYARVKNWRASSLLLFLKDIVPKEAHIAQKSLARFDEALLVMGLEARMKTGRRVL
ncbi:hypothetical protein EDB83DRAFT_2671414 [Lactarius deliciosus]|nr:hypothetical protein EDB83DRAFT_2671414 [Lactarius deliciosus]